MRAISALACALLIGAALAGEAAAPPAFTKKPAAARAGDKVKIDFAVSRETDVSVFIEDGNGNIVRHLVSGMLGKNPPAPLKAGMIEQSIEWDGKADWGKPAPGGPFKVRVALGMSARYDKVLIREPQNIGGIGSLAVGKDGTVFATTWGGPSVANWGSSWLVALNRDGSYQRTLVPPPATITKEQLAALGGAAVEVDGRLAPVTMSIRGRTFAGGGGSSMTVTPDGRLLSIAGEGLGLVEPGSGPGPWPNVGGPKLLPGVKSSSFNTGCRSFVACSADGKWAYVTGLAPDRFRDGKAPPLYSAVFRAKLPERAPAEPFFGEPGKPGSDETHLGGAPAGLAVDGKGCLLVADPGNKRVVAVSEADGKFAGSFPVESPESLAADPGTGAVYVLRALPRRDVELVKFSGWKDAKAVAKLSQPAGWDEPKWALALDSSVKPPVVWLTNNRRLLRIEDLGDKFGEVRQVNSGAIGDAGFVNLLVDHFREDPEIYWRSMKNGWTRCNEKTGKLDGLGNMGLNDASGSCLEVGPDGTLYAPGWPQHLFKWDRNGKPLKWDAPFGAPPGAKVYGDRPPANAIYSPVSMTFMTHTLGVRQDGRIFIFEPAGEGGRPNKMLREYEPSGKRVGDPIIWKVSDAAVGPKFDQQGNIYIAEQVHPANVLAPPEFAGFIGPTKPGQHFNDWDPRGNPPQMYGSIIKFSPKGGMVDWGTGYSGLNQNPFAGQPKLDPALKTVELGAFVGNDERYYCSAKVTGAEWVHFGISHLELFYCNCENTRFDVDLFGRVWYPDLCRFRVEVLDTNGNEITRFGGYGNAESMGPDSPVVDPQTKLVRPRKADDPKDLKSPFAEPEIAFAWLIGVGATDRYAYMGDSLNRRLLRAKLVYAAEESCPLP